MKLTAIELAALLGVQPQVVARWAKVPGFPRHTGRGIRGDPHRWPEDRVAAWLEGCAAADELRFIERATLHDAAAEKRERRIEERRTLLSRIADLMDEGATYHEIADKVDSTYWTVRRLAERNNLHLNPNARSRGAPRRHSEDDLIAALITASEWAGHPVSQNEYNRWRATVEPEAPTSSAFRRRLNVRWVEALRMAGMDAQDHAAPHSDRWTDDEMLNAIAAAGCPSLARYEAWRLNNKAPSATAIIGRFGSWTTARSMANGPESQNVGGPPQHRQGDRP